MEIFKLFGSILMNTSEADKSMQKTDSKAKAVASTLGNGVKTAAKWGTAIVGGATAAAGAAVLASKKFVDSYADYEQLVGGVETLFKDNANKVQEYADKAYKTAGMTANQYMETVTSFSASLLQGLDGDAAKAADAADMAITDMSDNANKMGSDITSIQTAYQGFAKQNYTMLDNLKLGYGGTKQEMERLLADAEKISGQKYDMSNLNDVYEAIHTIQTEMGITGTTAKEAESTISGSIGMLKSQLENLKTDIGKALAPTIKSIIGMVSKGMPTIVGLVNKITPVVKQLMDKLIPPLMDMASKIMPSLIALVSTLIPFISDIASDIIPIIVDTLVGFMPTLMDLIQQIMPVLIQLFSSIMPIVGELAKSLMPPLVEVFNALMPPILQLISALIPPLCDLLTMIVPIVNALTPVIAALASVFSDRLTSAINSVMPVIDNIVGYFKNVIDFVKNVFTGNWEEAWKNVVGIFENIFGGIVNVIKIPLNTVIDAINSVFSSLGELKIPKWVPKIGGETFSLPQIPRLANGGLAYGETLTTVGDNANANIDPEVIAPLSQLESIMGSGNKATENLLAAILDQLKNLNIITQYIDQTKKTDPQDIRRLSEALGFDNSRQAASIGAW